jgi:peroxiredoxin
MKLIIFFALFIFNLGGLMAIDLGSKIPEVNLYGYDMKPKSLSEFMGKNLVVAFFPGAFTGVCTKEVCTLQDGLGNFNQMNAEVIGVTVDSPLSNKNWAEKNKVTFPIFSDYSRLAIKAFGVELFNFAGMEGYTAAKRSVFIFDKEGTLKYKWVSDNPGVEPPYEELNKELSKL